jgi:hypothetical protein
MAPTRKSAPCEQSNDDSQVLDATNSRQLTTVVKFSIVSLYEMVQYVVTLDSLLE